MSTPLDLSHLSKYINEADIEQWLYDNPDLMANIYNPFYRWIGRQVRLPSGILDLLGISLEHRFSYHVAERDVWVVEVKNVDITSSALTQVSRYAHDVRAIFRRFTEGVRRYHFRIHKVVIGPEIDTVTFREAEAMGIYVFTFDLNLSLNLGGYLSWKEPFIEDRNNEYESIAEGGIFDEIKEDIETFIEETSEDESEEIEPSENGRGHEEPVES